MRLPLRALPVAIRAVRAGRRALWLIGDALAEAERDLTSMVEPVSVNDLTTICPGCFYYLGGPNGSPCAACVAKARPAVCIDCGTSDDAGLCDSCAVLNTGRLAS